jgi:hypothetical protein
MYILRRYDENHVSFVNEAEGPAMFRCTGFSVNGSQGITDFGVKKKLYRRSVFF